MDNLYKELCDRVKQYRIHYPLTQSELAAKSGVSVRSISRFECGEDIGLSNFLKIMRALDLEERFAEAVPDQTDRPSYHLENAKKRSRVRSSSDKEKSDDKPFVWGEDK